MKQAVILVPVGDAMVRDPKTKTFLSKEGELKQTYGWEGRYWRRRLRGRSVRIVDDYIREKPVTTKLRKAKEA